MKICLITAITPMRENVRGTSALPYHLMAKRNEDIDIEIYTFNSNNIAEADIKEVEKTLNVKVNVMPLPRWYMWMLKACSLPLRVLLRYPFMNYLTLPQDKVNKINNKKPDLIWVMGEELSRIVKQFPEQQRIQTGPDTESLYYYRMMGRRFVMNNAMDYWKCAMMYRKYARMEKAFCTDDNFTYYAVGEEDINHLRQLNPEVKCEFLRHPHYEVSDDDGERKSFHAPKMRLLIAGRNDLYMRQEADGLCAELEAHSSELQNSYVITFLGKGWERHVTALREKGFDVKHISFAPDYIQEITRHDIQITPIAIGTGTKGKVLDALANGLLVIGTGYAMENIAVENGVSCIEYRQPSEVVNVLVDISTDREKYEKMAAKGRQCVLKYHDRKLLSKYLFGIRH